MSEPEQKKSTPFGETLELIEQTHPNLHRYLAANQARRGEVLAALASGVRLRGLEQLIEHMERLCTSWQNDTKMHPLSVLIQRALVDVVDIFEATLIDSLSVMTDRSRDLMEIELLLKDFALDTSRVGHWFTAGDDAIRKQYGPAAIRERLHRAAVPPFENTKDSMDYQAHSKMLHVTPLGYRIFIHLQMLRSIFSAWDDTGFYEIFFHANGVLIAADQLAQRYAHEPGVIPRPVNLSRFEQAYSSTNEMVGIRDKMLERLFSK